MEQEQGRITISRVYGHEKDKVKIEVVTPENKLVVRLYMPLEDFAKGIFGLAQLDCEYVTERGKE